MNKIYKAFPGGKFKVLTLSYDDGKEADRRLVEIFNKYGIKATFNLNSNLDKNKGRIPSSEWPELYKGHEVAVHTLNHPTMIRLNDFQATKEIIEDKNNLESIMLKPVRGIAYPNGSCDQRIADIAKHCGIKYGRLAGDKYAYVKAAEQYAKDADGPILLGDETGFSMPDDYMRWLPTCHHNHNLIEFGKKFCELTKKQYLYMMYVWGHSFEFEKDDTWNIIEEFCELVGNRDDIWYATNIEIVDYDEAYYNLQFFANNEYVYNPSAIPVWIIIDEIHTFEIKPGETVHLVY